MAQSRNGDILKKKVERLEALAQLLVEELEDLKQALQNPDALQKRLQDAKYQKISRLDQETDALLDELVQIKKQVKNLRQ